MVKFVEVYEKSGSNTFAMREITINPQHVVAFREDVLAKSALQENRMPEGLSKKVGFTRIYLNSGQFNLNVVVAEPPDMVESKITNSKKLLKG